MWRHNMQYIALIVGSGRRRRFRRLWLDGLWLIGLWLDGRWLDYRLRAVRDFTPCALVDATSRCVFGDSHLAGEG